MDHNTETNVAKTRGQRFAEWLQDPMGGVIAASITTIGSLGVVVSGIWFVNLAIN